jgi:hypothetical protein
MIDIHVENDPPVPSVVANRVGALSIESALNCADEALQKIDVREIWGNATGTIQQVMNMLEPVSEACSRFLRHTIDQFDFSLFSSTHMRRWHSACFPLFHRYTCSPHWTNKHSSFVHPDTPWPGSARWERPSSTTGHTWCVWPYGKRSEIHRAGVEASRDPYAHVSTRQQMQRLYPSICKRHKILYIFFAYFVGYYKPVIFREEDFKQCRRYNVQRGWRLLRHHSQAPRPISESFHHGHTDYRTPDSSRRRVNIGRS